MKPYIIASMCFSRTRGKDRDDQINARCSQFKFKSTCVPFSMLLWNILLILGTTKLQEMQWSFIFTRPSAHQDGKNLNHFKLRIFSLLPPNLKKPHRNKVPVTHRLEENNILCLFFLTIFRVSRSMDYHHLWLLVREIIYNKYCSCLQQTYNVYSSFRNTV